LTEQEKEVYLTFREISQLEIVRQAGMRQKYVDQAQSINLAFPADVDERYFHKVHLEAWKVGLKTLYYCRSKGVLKGDIATRVSDMINKEIADNSDCAWCEG
jgi:ribonucleoside-diphosphate reductase alpha chain